MAYLADTNVIARWIQPGDPLYPVARVALRTLRNRGEQVCTLLSGGKSMTRVSSPPC
jgi:hypothetical protein